MSGLYLHIPFCRKRCLYCDFFSTTNGLLMPRYVDALCQELALRHDELKGELNTIYLGGGTPSQLSIEQLRQIFDSVSLYFDTAKCVEITMEANPDDLSPEYIKQLQSLPINRLSLGVQSFDDRDLTALNRRHTAGQAIDAVHRCQEAGFHNISIDLIYGLPKQTIKGWQQNIRQAIELNISHLSAYHLIYEEGTMLTKLLEAGKIVECDEEESLQFFRTLIDELNKVGFEQYEISNFAQSGMYARHNTSYWQDEAYLGLGAAAHSYDKLSRKCNVANMEEYLQKTEHKETAYETETIGLNTRYNDLIITSLRTMWGVKTELITTLFGQERTDYCMRMAQKYLKQGTLLFDGETLKLSREGIFISDSILSDLLYTD